MRTDEMLKVQENHDELMGQMTVLRNALWEATTNGRWTEGQQCGEWAISKEVAQTVSEVLDAYDARVADAALA